jgi:undecaprenyl-diphosphatase
VAAETHLQPREAATAPPDPVAVPAAGHFAARSLAGLIAVLGAGVGFGLLLALVRLHWQPLSHLDHDVAADLNALVSRHHWMVTTLTQISRYGGRPFLIPLIVVASVALAVRRRYRLAVYLLVTGIGALILDPALKAVVGRLRPVVESPVAHAPGNSFPSGHALGSFVAYGALLLVFLPALGRWGRRILVPLAALVVLAIGFSRIGLGVHYLSDVLGGWLLGAAWLGITGYAFQLWRTEVGRPAAPLAEGLEPEQAPELTPAPAERVLLPHPWTKGFELVTGWILVFGACYGLGILVTHFHLGLDHSVPAYFAAHRTPRLNGLSWWASKAGDTHAILFLSLVFAVVAAAALRRLRPVLFLTLVMFGELSLFLAVAAAVRRPRPMVTHLDGPLPTSSFPSGHIAATICLWWVMVLVVWPRTHAWWRWILGALAVLMPALVATSRMYRGMHHPTDVAGAVLLSTLLLTLVYLVVRPNADLRAAPAKRGHVPPAPSETERSLQGLDVVE